jgi:uncharacterized membrane protein
VSRRELVAVLVAFVVGAVTGAWVATRWVAPTEPAPITVVCLGGERMLPEWAWRRSER